jgi:hypothetical protein
MFITVFNIIVTLSASLGEKSTSLVGVGEVPVPLYYSTHAAL